MPKLSKALSELTASDLQSVVDSEWIEDEVLEFKQTLSQQDGGRPDRWLVDQSEIGKQAKRKLLAEVVAMANSYGGDVLLGVEQAPGNPPKAVRLNPIPKCIELAARLELAARDLIKPQIPMLGVRGIPIDGEAGVVVFRVPRSRLAPHRLEMADFVKECYRRVGERTEAMTMREIQDLTFSVSRGLQQVEDKLSLLRAEFGDWVTLGPFAQRHGYMISAVPLAADLYIEKVHGVAALTPTAREFNVVHRAGTQSQTYPPLRQPTTWRPILRGTEARMEHSVENALIKRLTCDGTYVEMTRYSTPPQDQRQNRPYHHLYPSWLFSAVLNGFECIETFREAAGAASSQYAVDITVACTVQLPVMSMNAAWPETLGTFPAGVTPLPRYVLGEPESWHDTVNLMWTDFWNAIGVDSQTDNIRVAEWL
jgi:hypothetical protein